MASRHWDLTALLSAADPRASRAERQLWLVRVLEWVRHGHRRADDAAPKPALRLVHLLGVLERHPEHRARAGALLLSLWREADLASLFADVGFTARRDFLGELGARLKLRFLPIGADTTDVSLLFHLLFEAGDATWIAALDEPTLRRIGALVADAAAPGAGRLRWRAPLCEAMRSVASHIHAAGLSAHLRQRMSPDLLARQPFGQLPRALEAVADPLEGEGGAPDPAAARIAANYLRALLDRCHRAADSVHDHLEEFGVSVNIVFEVDQLHARIRRLDALLDCALAEEPAREMAGLVARLVALTGERRSIRAHFARHYSLLARKVAERNAETGEHYITRDRREFRAMLRKAAGGGTVIAGTTFVKFAIGALGLGAFWAGFWAGVNYAASFLLIHLMHFTVATKQPAMTAPAMAEKLRDIGDPERLEGFVDEVAHLVRSQVAGIAGNLLLVAPLVLAVQALALLALGQPLVGAAQGEHVLHSLTLLGPTALYAAFTGVLLFASSLIAGWAENFTVYHRLDGALAWNPKILARLGAARARRWAAWARANVSGIAANLSLGLMLGLVPPILSFFGPPIEVRHVTLSTGQLAAAAVALGWPVLQQPAFWWCVAGIAVTGVLNLAISFGLAMRLALRSRGIAMGRERRRIYAAIWKRLLRAPRSFLLPPR